MSYVDDILTVGLQDSSDRFFAELSQLLLIKHFGELRTSGKDIPFLGRVLQRGGAGIHLLAPKSYTQEMVNILGRSNGRSVGTTGTSSPTKRDDGTSHVDSEGHRIYRRAVGQQLWLVSRRPDVSYVAKKLSRTLQSPTKDDYAKLQHAIRYRRGMEN